MIFLKENQWSVTQECNGKILWVTGVPVGSIKGLVEK
jgi:hypothetical protein